MDPDNSISILQRSEFPQTLREMKSPPKQLYIRGQLIDSPNQKYLCVIGSRKSTEYGRECVNTLVRGLAGYPISIVSGLAIGIDSMAHIAALESGLHCVAFPGSTLDWDQIYPQSHRLLAEKILLSGGALVSEWESGHVVGNWAFPSRNRLMAGLAHAVLIIEAGKKSGSLMTAEHALQFGRDVLAVPGHINVKNSYGTHMLIQRGAALVTSSEDILGELGFEITNRLVQPHISDSLKENVLCLKLLELLSYQNYSNEQLLIKTQIHPSELNVALSLMEIEQLINIQNGVISLRR